MSKHTPGPWSVVDGHYPSMQEIQGPSFKINIVMSATDLNFQDYLSRSADARLIAAAPELLDSAQLALSIAERWIRDQLEGTSHLESAMQSLDPVRAAIRKALGEE